MVLIDDPEKKVIEPLFEQLTIHQKIYDTDLMMDGGHITGYKIADEQSINDIIKNIQTLADKGIFKDKYQLKEDL
jgi:hypothetical protein